MLSILSHEYTDSRNYTDSREATASTRANERERRTGNFKSRLGDQLDEIAVFAFVAVAVMYIAAATYGLVW